MEVRSMMVRLRRPLDDSEEELARGSGEDGLRLRERTVLLLFRAGG